MAGTTLTEREQFKATILTNAIDGKITNAQAAKKLGYQFVRYNEQKQFYAEKTHMSLCISLKELEAS